MRVLFKQNGSFVFPSLVLFAAGFLMQQFFTRTELFMFVNHHEAAWADPVFMTLTDMGDGLFYVAVSLVFLFINMGKGIITMACYLISGQFAQLLKRAFFPNEPRPTAFYSHHEVLRAIPNVHMYLRQSFPSGHTVSAFSLGLLLTAFARNKKWGYFYFVMACGIGYSRMYLEEHFFDDVLGGAVIGLTITLISYYFLIEAPFLKRDWANQRLKLPKIKKS